MDFHFFSIKIERKVSSPICKLSKISSEIDIKKRLVETSRFFGGGGWIRTTEARRNRFTVCPLWPLGNSSICMELVMGLEPATCWLQISCSTNWATPACYFRDYNTVSKACQHFFEISFFFFQKNIFDSNGASIIFTI